MKKIFSLVALAGMFMLMSFSFNAEQNPPKVSCDDMATDFANDHPEFDWCQAYDAMHDTCEDVFENTDKKIR